MRITESNVPKVISVATGIYWLAAGLLLLGDVRTGEWMGKLGHWVGIVLLTGTCGVGFWLRPAPVVLRSFRAGTWGRGPRAWGRGIWCFSTIPVVILCFGMICTLVYFRITE